MDFIPLIRMKNRKIYLKKEMNEVSLKEFLKMLEGKKKLYILDLDGIERDKPNLCTFQRLSSSVDLWVDFGPRDVGDVVDATMAGATDITLRKNLFPKLDISKIKEIAENNIHTNIDLYGDSTIKGFDGIVNFNSRSEIEKNFDYTEQLKRIGQEGKLYSYESELSNLSYWKYFGVSGLLIDIDKIEVFKNAV